MKIIIASLLLTTPALAQQQQQISPAALGLQITSAVSALAQGAEQAQDLQQEVARLKAQLDEVTRSCKQPPKADH